ncbi:VirB8/TrbF family protein [Candidatus Fokinia crypta]|uniref:Type IV secretion VirB8 protein n=1 Tax=Candidatus Fokinia crypta TaxID=1920990 RepID=A0ABZ0UPG7_9RICK|nr:VirB8/TrbF family protein [Candidatus Fokinia cryptica]WPX98021.1 Type IV secretion VirB8 protein [Candidatus Fokinia cryptica]
MNNSTDKIDLQQYFDDVRCWYFTKYLSQYRDFVYLSIVLLLVSAALALNISTYLNGAQVKKRSFVLYNENAALTLKKVRPLNVQSDINASIAEYILQHYVILRETYTPSLMNEKLRENTLKKVFAISSEMVADDYRSIIEPSENSDSPILLYGNSKSKAITMIRVMFLPYNDVPSNCIVEFESCEKDVLGNVQNIQKSRIHIEFQMSDASAVLRGDSEFGFLVVRYEVM